MTHNNLSHWQDLVDKLGKDVVRYFIQPYLMPSTNGVRRNRRKVHAQIKCIANYDEYSTVKTKVKMANNVVAYANRKHDEIRPHVLRTSSDKIIANLKLKGFDKLHMLRIWRQRRPITYEWIRELLTTRRISYRYDDLQPPEIRPPINTGRKIMFAE